MKKEIEEQEERCGGCEEEERIKKKRNWLGLG